MKQYIDILKTILENGTIKKTRTGVDTLSITGVMFECDLINGFPLLTTKKMPYKSMLVELEGFIKGITSKKWYKDRGCNFWNYWCNPKKVSYGTDVETQMEMEAEDDLGLIYGYMWRKWPYIKYQDNVIVEQGQLDQFKIMIEKLKTNPLDRRNIVTAWNPGYLDQMALPPCHYGFQVLSDGINLDLLWNQRSNDFPIGNPVNIASYATLLCLIAKETNLIPRKLIGFLADVHIYLNQVDGVKEQIKREPFSLPKVDFPGFTSIYDWDYTQFNLIDYKHHDKINFAKVAV